MFDQTNVGTDHQADGGAHQRDGKRVADDALHLLAFAERARDENSAEGSRNGTQTQPLHESEVDGATAQVDQRTDRLHHRARHQVR
jgi:hypothetical protein